MRKTLPLILVGAVIAGAGIIHFTAQAASDRLAKKSAAHSSETAESDVTADDCKARDTKSKNYTVLIENDTMIPSKVTAKLCDRLTIVNGDSKTREIAFGAHDRHTSVERKLDRSDMFTTDLLTAGEFTFHDHLDYRVKGFVVVTD